MRLESYIFGASIRSNARTSSGAILVGAGKEEGISRPPGELGGWGGGN